VIERRLLTICTGIRQMMTRPDSDIDAAILSAASDQWKKVAMIIATVVHRHKLAAEYALIAQRIVDLVNSGRLESQGNLSNWRGSEVRLTKAPPSLASTVDGEEGNANESIELLQQAAKEEPTSLPHLYRLAVLLMNTEQWLDANSTLDELIRLSEQRNDFYFLDNARFRKIMCLKLLGRFEEIQAQRDKIAPNTEVFIGAKRYGISDL
jgi:hypothetical protein